MIIIIIIKIIIHAIDVKLRFCFVQYSEICLIMHISSKGSLFAAPAKETESQQTQGELGFFLAGETNPVFNLQMRSFLGY